MQRVLLAVQSMAAGNGGIARVARLMAKTIAGSARGVACDCLIYENERSPFEGAGSATGWRSKGLFYFKAHAGAAGHTHYLYDSLNMARAHPRHRPLRRPSLVWIHGIEVWEQSRPAWLAAAERADILVANSAFTRARSHSLHGIFERSAVCWLATEDDAPPETPATLTGPPVVVLVGRLDPISYKGHEELINCWPQVVAACPEARLVIAGRGPGLDRLKRLAGQTGVRGRIDFKGFVPEDEMPGLWQQATMFAMPSRGEGFGLAYIEAMRQGLPVVASVHDAAPELNIDGVTGFNVDLGRRTELPDAVVRLFRDRDLARQLGENGRQRWHEHFRFSAFQRRFLPVLDTLLRLQV